ncbi:IS5 family transposase [Burkholderia ubonensis]|uniref:IS5 family transposase n=1 Tax=Burkholderia ubonensis TaxID=101571 RepID=UPI0009B4225D
MKQTDLGLNLSTKRTRKREFLDEMNRVVPWADLVMLIAPYAPEGKRGRPPFAVEAMLRIHFLQQWFGLSDPAMEEALHDVPLYREFAGLDNWTVRLPDESTILRFRHLLEKRNLAAQILALVNEILRDKGLMLRAGTVVDATLISAPSSTKNASGERNPEMHQSKKGNQWYFGMKAHIGVDAESGLVHMVRGTSGNISDVLEANSLLHGEETDPIHKAKLVQDFVQAQKGRLKLFYLPPYSPHLNPDEQVWAHVKRSVSKRLVQTKDEMKRLAIGALRRIQKLPALVKSFFRQPECQYAAM